MRKPVDILQRILIHKAEEIARGQTFQTIYDLEAMIKNQEDPRGFCANIVATINAGKPAVIAELKKASPSKGVIRSDFEPEVIAKSYAQNGATCLSVLTDVNFFQGHNDFLSVARKASGLEKDLDNVQCIVMSDTGHNMYMERPDALAKIVSDFVNSHELPRRV